MLILHEIILTMKPLRWVVYIADCEVRQVFFFTISREQLLCSVGVLSWSSHYTKLARLKSSAQTHDSLLGPSVRLIQWYKLWSWSGNTTQTKLKKKILLHGCFGVVLTVVIKEHRWLFICPEWVFGSWYVVHFMSVWHCTVQRWHHFVFLWPKYISVGSERDIVWCHVC